MKISSVAQYGNQRAIAFVGQARLGDLRLGDVVDHLADGLPRPGDGREPPAHRQDPDQDRERGADQEVDDGPVDRHVDRAEVDRHPVLELELVGRVEVLGATAAAGASSARPEQSRAVSASPHPVFASPPSVRDHRKRQLDRERERVHGGGLETEGGVPRGDDDEDRHQHDRAEHPTHGHEAAVAELIHPDRNARQQVADAPGRRPSTPAARPQRARGPSPRSRTPAAPGRRRRFRRGAGRLRLGIGLGRRRASGERSAVADVDAADADRHAEHDADDQAGLERAGEPADQRARRR